MTYVTGPLQIDDNDLDDLLSALRRHHLGDTTRLLDRWSTSEPDLPPHADDGELWIDDELVLRRLDHPLTGWAHREISEHVAAGRFEHALCLVEKYRRDLTSADMVARITYAQGAAR